MRSESGFEARQLLREASFELARLRRIRGAYRTTWRRIARARARLAFAAALLAAPFADPAAAGTPSFRHGFIFATGSEYFCSPTFVDIDGDGDLDVFVGEYYGNTVFFANTGTASAPAFAAPSTNPFGLTDVGFFASPDFADLDGDGDLDAFVGEEIGNTIFFENTGTANVPAFAASSTNPFGLAGVGGHASPDFADLDGDGDLDAFVGANSGNTTFFENTGTASAPAFSAPSTNPFGLADVGSRSSPTFADIDGDGDLDAFVGGTPYPGPFALTFFFENTGAASAPAFAAPQTLPFGLNQVLYYAASLAFADVDGDGDLDALVGDYFQTIAFENTGTASAPAFTLAGNPFGLTGEHPTFADLDGDGDLDAFVGKTVSITAFFENTGTANAAAFASPATNPFGLTAMGSSVSPAFADIDGDGDLDALFGSGSGNTVFFQNTGTVNAPAFASPSTNPFGLADVGSVACPAFADLDDDGDLDAFVGEGSGNTILFANTGTASAPAFATPSTNPFGLADVGQRASPAVADLDGDGDLDVFVGQDGVAVVGEDSGNTIFFENTGTASAPAFATPSTNPFGLVDVGEQASPDFADLDDDGDLDAFVGAAGFGRIFLFENVTIDPEACIDGLDNDSDGRIDLGTDPGCASAADTSELSTRQCDNGLDDDADGKIDWRGDGTGDLECVGLRDDREAPTPPGASCGLGPELLLLAPLLTAARRRSPAAVRRG